MTQTQPAAASATQPDEMLVAALEDGDIPVLLMVLYHLTADETWLRPPYTPGADEAIFADPSGRLAPEIQQTVRSEAARVISAYLRGELVPAAPPDESTLTKMMSVSVGETVPDEYAPMALEEMGFAERAVHWRRRPDQATLEAFSVLIIGAGESGICAGIKLKSLGIPFMIIEKNPDVGGTWFENSYPGCGVDVPNHFYSYSFAPKDDWPDYYSKRADLHDYFRRCAADYGITDHIRFQTEVIEADYDSENQRWAVTVRTPDGGIEHLDANVLISAVGQLNRPQIPNFPGRDTFEGVAFHSAQWRHDVDLTGLRVAVIGTGASAAQLLPPVAEAAGHVTVFQRTAQWLLPNSYYHRSVSPEKQWLLRHVPFYAGWYRFGLFWRLGDRIWPTLVRDPDWPNHQQSINVVNDRYRFLLTRYITKQLANRPDLLEQCIPDYAPFSKRLPIDNHWFPTLCRDNVELVTDDIAEITKTGVVTADGVERPFDVIVYATGFHSTQLLFPMAIRGWSGRALADVWNGDDARAYLGITVPDFPNLFCLYGPNTNLAFGGSIILHSECQTHCIMACLREMLEGGYGAMEVRQDAFDAYNRRLDAAIDKMIWSGVDVNSWYKNSRKRVVTNTPWRLIDYWRMTKAPELAAYRLVPKPAAVEGYDIERIRADWIGRVVGRGRGRYPVEHDPIRRWCHMVGDTNPLYLDPDAASVGPHGAVIAPLPLVPYFAGNGPWPRRDGGRRSSPGFTLGIPTPGDRGINLGTAWEYFAPVRVGDRLRSEVVVADVFVKPIGLDPEAVWIVSDTRIFNQDDDLVVVMRNTGLVHRTPEQIGAQA